MSRLLHPERHRVHRIGWLRAAVLGANDGIVSTASLIIGVASAGSAHGEVLIAGLAGLVAGAMSMAAGEYVSVSSQRERLGCACHGRYGIGRNVVRSQRLMAEHGKLAE